MQPATSHGSRCTRITRLGLLLAMLAVGLVGPAAPPARAETRVVANTNNVGAGSLREAIADAASGDTITFAPNLSGGTIYAGSPLVLDKDLTIDGSALAVPVTLSGNGAVRVMEVMADTAVTLNGLVIADGMADDDAGGIAPGYGGGIYSLGALTVVDCTFSDNSAEGKGGAIYSTGELTVTRCTFAGNLAVTDDSGGDGGGIYASPTVAVTDSTFSGNVAGQMGGAAHVAGRLTVANSTFSNNLAMVGGAVSGLHTLTVANSTFSGNIATAGGGASGSSAH